jgi:ribonuclease HI
LVLPRKQIYKFTLMVLYQPYNLGRTACYAFIIKNEEGYTIHREYGLAARNSTNNVAEYTGLIKALDWLVENHYQNQTIVIMGDSRLVIYQIKKEFQVRAPTIITLYRNSIYGSIDNRVWSSVNLRQFIAFQIEEKGRRCFRDWS